MSDAAAEDVEEIDGEEGEEEAKGGFSGKKLVLFIVLPLLLVVGGAGGAFMMGMFGGGEEEQAEVGEDGKKVVDPSKIVFYELPELIINLRSKEERAAFVKFRVTLELHDPTALPKIEPLMPRIMDNFQIYLRELRPSDLDGSAGLFRLKEEILRRINMDVRPYEVADVLFTEMIIQ
jgi:flagellar FliL protein